MQSLEAMLIEPEMTDSQALKINNPPPGGFVQINDSS